MFWAHDRQSLNNRFSLEKSNYSNSKTFVLYISHVSICIYESDRICLLGYTINSVIVKLQLSYVWKDAVINYFHWNLSNNNKTNLILTWNLVCMENQYCKSYIYLLMKYDENNIWKIYKVWYIDPITYQ